MKRKLFEKIATLSVLSLSFLPTIIADSAYAQLRFGSNDVYKFGNKVFIAGTPNASIPVVFAAGATQLKSAQSNACKLAIISLTASGGIMPTSVKINGSSTNTATLPFNSIPKCDATSGILADTRTENFKTTDNKLVVVTTSANSQVTAEYNAQASVNAKINACGFASINPPTGTSYVSSTAIKIGGTDYTFGSIPNASGGDPKCQNVNGSMVPYRPITSGW